MAKVIIGIGNVGSGKTSILKPFALNNGYYYISPDLIREELTGDVMNQSRNKDVWMVVQNEVANAIENNQTIVVDATFAEQFRRKEFADFCHQLGAGKVVGVFVDTPAELSAERNRNRERVVPNHVHSRMQNQLDTSKPRTYKDNFDSIFTLNENGEIKKLEVADGEGFSEVKKFK
jgi:predicted kinase